MGICSDSADPLKTGRNDLPIVNIAQADAGMQTDHVVTTQVDGGSQTDHHDMDKSEPTVADLRRVSLDKEEQTRMAAQGEVELCPVGTQEGQNCFFEQHNRGFHATNSIDLDHRPPQHYLHHVVAHPLDDSRCNQPSLIHGFFTLHEYKGQLAYTLTFFELTADPSSHSADSETPSLARDEAAERLSTVPEFPINHDEISMFDRAVSRRAARHRRLVPRQMAA
jgi:hypothetical protein